MVKPCWPSMLNVWGGLGEVPPRSIRFPGWEKLMWGLELLLLWESPGNIVIFQSVGLPSGPGGYGISYIVQVPLLPSHCGFFFVFGCRIFNPEITFLILVQPEEF